jgi:hypothetical protein
MMGTSSDAGAGDAAIKAHYPGTVPENITPVIRAINPQFMKCYKAALAQATGESPEPHGTVTSKFVVALDDTVEIVHSFSTDRSIPQSMVDCVSLAWLSAVFPKPVGGKVMLTAPVTFHGAE